MPRAGSGSRSAAGALLFLSHIPAGLNLPHLPGALCEAEGHDPDMWHPENGSRAEADAARAVCARCPVRARCLQWALDANEEHGVWGGTSPGERAALRRAMRAASSPAGAQASAEKAVAA
jgi:WhiB family transcriptional regulator, redox-sensing transcriptional regulator